MAKTIKKTVKKVAKDVEKEPKKKGKRVPQSVLPKTTLKSALRVASALSDEFGGAPTAPHLLAMAIDISPTSSSWRDLSGAAVGYGLTTAGYAGDVVALTDLGRRCVSPVEEGDDQLARREAALIPEVMGGFYKQYNRSKFPSDKIAKNVIVQKFGVPVARADAAFKVLKANGEFVGHIAQTKTGLFVDADSPAPLVQDDVGEEGNEPESDVQSSLAQVSGTPKQMIPSSTPARENANRRVFITHGKNRKFIDPIKKLLGFGEMTPVVSVDQAGVSQPVPDKVMNDMRGCGAAIIHVDAEGPAVDGKNPPINPNVLIEIGAAMALYGRRFILLVRRGVTLPSNLQGLFEVRYDGEALDGDATIQLLSAITDIKNHAPPERYPEGVA